MSLKNFHLLFVGLSILLSAGCAVLALNELVLTGNAQYASGLAVALLATFTLTLYEVRVIRKFRLMGLSHRGGRP
jgi:hypothetical protein